MPTTLAGGEVAFTFGLVFTQLAGADGLPVRGIEGEDDAALFQLLSQVEALLHAADEHGQVEVGRSFAGNKHGSSCIRSDPSHDGP